MTDVRIVNAEALVVGPDETLVVRLPEDLRENDSFAIELGEIFDRVGLHDRVVFAFGDIQFAKVKRGET